MVQVLKDSVRTAIQAAALRRFADHGYPGTSVAQIAAAAQTAPGNVYRYFPSKAALFDAVVPPGLPERHDALLDTRIAALSLGPADRSAAAAELLDFWLDQPLAVAVLLDRAEGTPHAGYPAAFVQRLVRHAEELLPTTAAPAHRQVLDLVFDNTRRALAHILRTAEDRAHAHALVDAFWAYQLPGLDGLMAFFRSAPDAGPGPSSKR